MKLIYYCKIYDLVFFLMIVKLNKLKDGLFNILYCKLDILFCLVIILKCLEGICFVFVIIFLYMWVMLFNEKKVEKNIYMFFLEFFFKVF